MLLTISNESQAVLQVDRLFFSPSAATLCGTPDPTLRLSRSARRPVRAPAGLGPGPGPAGGRNGLLPILGHWEVLAGPGRAWAQAGQGARARSRIALRGFRRWPGSPVRLTGFPSSGHRAPPTLFSSARVTLLPCLPCVQRRVQRLVSVALTISRRGPLGSRPTGLPRRRRRMASAV
jgi:hypothetical protein